MEQSRHLVDRPAFFLSHKYDLFHFFNTIFSSAPDFDKYFETAISGLNFLHRKMSSEWAFNMFQKLLQFYYTMGSIYIDVFVCFEQIFSFKNFIRRGSLYNSL